MTVVAAELRKANTTRTARWLLLAGVVVVAVGSFSTASASSATDLTGAVHDQPFFLLASVNLSIFALLVGVRSSTDEYRHGTIAWTLLAVPSRARVVAAKALVAAGYGAALGLLAQLAGLAVALPAADSQGGDLMLTRGDLGAALGLGAAVALWAALGVGVGTVIRHQVAAVVLVIVWVLAVENLGASLLGDAGRFLPGQAAHGLADVDTSTAMLSAPMAGVVLAAYVAAFLVAAGIVLVRRPVQPG